MQPESSDGLASVGTILPEEGAALLPGGSFRFCGRKGPVCEAGREFVTAAEFLDTYLFLSVSTSGRVLSTRDDALCRAGIRGLVTPTLTGLQQGTNRRRRGTPKGGTPGKNGTAGGWL